MNLKTGDKVICIDPTGYLVEGETYTVKATFGEVTSHNSITVDECVVNAGFKSYKINRFEKVKPPNLVAITQFDLETIQDAIYALDYYSEGTFVNLEGLAKVADNIERQMTENDY
jgi:hypothetical protein